MLDNKLRKGIECCIGAKGNCIVCPYDTDENGIRLGVDECKQKFYDDLTTYIEDCENVIKLLEATT